ncbi:MAG: 1,2-phenylacetyl-CoA epoxidase subunit PaaB [Bacteroidia bacterium]
MVNTKIVNQQMKDSQGPLWEVFVQKKAGQPFVHCGSLHAYDKEMALENARDLYTRRSEGSALWVVPAAAIVASSPEDIGAFFDPANDKVYRHPTFYQIPEGVKYI